MTAMMMASVASPVKPETRAATSSRSSNGLRSCPHSMARALIRCELTTLGPSRLSRPAASRLDRPESLLPSRFSTSSGARAAAVVRSSPAAGATVSAVVVMSFTPSGRPVPAHGAAYPVLPPPAAYVRGGIVATMTALMVCIRFSAWSNTMEAADSKTSSVTSRAARPRRS